MRYFEIEVANLYPTGLLLFLLEAATDISIHYSKNETTT